MCVYASASSGPVWKIWIWKFLENLGFDLVTVFPSSSFSSGTGGQSVYGELSGNSGWLTVRSYRMVWLTILRGRSARCVAAVRRLEVLADFLPAAGEEGLAAALLDAAQGF